MKIARNVAKGFAIGGMAAALLAGSVATAAWVVNGNFSIGVPGGNLERLDVSNVSVNTDGLLPTQKADLRFRLKNPNPIAVRGVANLHEPATVTSNVAGCAQHLQIDDEYTSSHAFVDERFDAGEVENFVFENVVSISNASPDSCEGADYEVLVITGATSAE